MTVKVGELEQIFSISLSIKNEEEASFEVPLHSFGKPMRIAVVFKSADEDQEKSISWKTENNIPKFTFLGWNNTFGTCTTEAEKFGEIENRKIYFRAVHQYVANSMNFLNFYVFLGNRNV